MVVEGIGVKYQYMEFNYGVSYDRNNVPIYVGMYNNPDTVIVLCGTRYYAPG
jgi:hypothetical protein